MYGVSWTFVGFAYILGLILPKFKNPFKLDTLDYKVRCCLRSAFAAYTP